MSDISVDDCEKGAQVTEKDLQYKKINGFEKNKARHVLIGVGGGTASGKSSVCRKIIDTLGQQEGDSKRQQVIIISLESFYRQLTAEEEKQAIEGQFNFDHPDAFDETLMVETFRLIKEGKVVKIPTYDYKNHQRVTKSQGQRQYIPRNTEDQWQIVYPADVILFEGILVFYFKEMRDLFNLKLFVDTDADTRLSRRVKRDMERGRDLNAILNQYTKLVKPAFEDFCLPTKKHADMIIPRGADNSVAISLIVQHIQDLLRKPHMNGNGGRRTRQNSDSTVSRPH